MEEKKSPNGSAYPDYGTLDQRYDYLVGYVTESRLCDLIGRDADGVAGRDIANFWRIWQERKRENSAMVICNLTGQEGGRRWRYADVAPARR